MKTCFAALVFCTFPVLVRAGAAEANPPNIVYILADDLGYGDVGANNPKSKIPTPRLDRLAAQGMRFTDAHSPSSVCTPTRHGILTGQYAWRSRLKKGVTWSYGRVFMDPERETVAMLLKEHGYRTGVVGKWHLGLDWALKDGPEHSLENAGTKLNAYGAIMDMDPRHIDFSRPVTRGPRDFGFDYSFILPASLDIPPYCFLENHELVTAPSAWTEGNDLDQGKAMAFWRPGKIAPDFDFYDVLPTITRKSIEFLETHAGNNEPFFLYLPLSAPHTPWLPTEAFVGTSGAGLYGDFVHMVDTQVGKVLDAIDRLGIEDDTLVIFTSDNGAFWRPSMVARHDHRAAHVFRGMKGDIWEGGHRVPFIVRWPGHIEAGSTSAAVTTLTHLIATSADLIGLPNPNRRGEDSYSILPVLLGKAAEVPGQPGIVMHSSEAHFAYREGDWKYIEKRGSGGFTSPAFFEVTDGEATGQLYNLADDPSESVNLFFSHPRKVKAMNRKLEQLRRS